MPFDNPAPKTLHQHMTDGYEAQVELRRRAGFSDDMMITSGDLMEQALSEIGRDCPFLNVTAAMRPNTSGVV